MGSGNPRLDFSQTWFIFSQDGVWVRGLYLEGAGWDRKNSCLIEAEPMQLVCLMPTIHFRPTESRKKTAKGEAILSNLLILFRDRIPIHPAPFTTPSTPIPYSYTPSAL